MKSANDAGKKRKPRKTHRRQRQRRPTLRFTPYAWAKLLYLRDRGDTEVGGFGISSSDDLLLVEDFRLVQQTCSSTSVEFDDTAVADFFDQQVDSGRSPEEFARIWLHTHPWDSAEPSGTDEKTFQRCFGSADWAVMCILARHGQRYARLRYGVGPGGDIEIPVRIDFECSFPGADYAAWDAEYEQSVMSLAEMRDGFFDIDADAELLSGFDAKLDVWRRAIGDDAEGLLLEVEG